MNYYSELAVFIFVPLHLVCVFSFILLFFINGLIHKIDYSLSLEMVASAVVLANKEDNTANTSFKIFTIHP